MYNVRCICTSYTRTLYICTIVHYTMRMIKCKLYTDVVHVEYGVCDETGRLYVQHQADSISEMETDLLQCNQLSMFRISQEKWDIF